MSAHPSIVMVQYAAEKLGDLRTELVFLGGAVVGLFATERGARPPRTTEDVDVTVQVSKITEFYALDQALISKGFANDMNGPICRYLHGSLKLDVMPMNPDVLGFTNRWYPLAIETAGRVQA